MGYFELPPDGKKALMYTRDRIMVDLIVMMGAFDDQGIRAADGASAMLSLLTILLVHMAQRAGTPESEVLDSVIAYWRGDGANQEARML